MAPAVIVVTATGALSLNTALPPITNPYGVSIAGSVDAPARFGLPLTVGGGSPAGTLSIFAAGAADW